MKNPKQAYQILVASPEKKLSVIEQIKPGEYVEINGKKYFWRPYEFVPLATECYLNLSILPFNYFRQIKDRFGWYYFMALPETCSIFIQSISKSNDWVCGIKMSCEIGKMQISQRNNRQIPK